MAQLVLDGFLKDKIEIFGRVLLDVDVPVKLTEQIPAESVTFQLPEKLSATVSETDGVFEVQLAWEGFNFATEKLSLLSTRHISIKPLPGFDLELDIAITEAPTVPVNQAATPAAEVAATQAVESAPEFPDQDPNVP